MSIPYRKSSMQTAGGGARRTSQAVAMKSSGTPSPPKPKKSEILEQLEELSRRMDEMSRHPRADDMRRQQLIAASELTPMSRPQTYQSAAFQHGELEIANMDSPLNRVSSYSRVGFPPDESSRINAMLENEAKERRKAEMKVLELTSQLEDARRGLRETQNALMDVQHAAEVLTQKRDERNAQFQKILMENKTLEAKIFELEMQLRNAEKATKGLQSSSEDRLSRLQDELTVALEASHKHQTENTRHKTDRARIEAELENAQRKIKAMETNFKHLEVTMAEEHQAEVSKLEDRLRSAMGQADEGRKNDVKLLDAKTEYYNKVNELKSAELKLVETESHRRQLEQKCTSLELQVHHLESQNRQKDVRINQLEQEALSASSEMNLLKNGVAKKDEEINSFIQESFEIGAKFDALRKVNKEYERKLASINVDDFNEQIAKLKSDLERRESQVKQLIRSEEDLNRQIKSLRDDNMDLEERLKSNMMSLSLAQSAESESKQSLKVCEQALNELKSEKTALTWKLNVEEKRANRLEETLRRAALTKGVALPNTQKPSGSMFPAASGYADRDDAGRSGGNVTFAIQESDMESNSSPKVAMKKEFPKPKNMGSYKGGAGGGGPAASGASGSSPEGPVAPKSEKPTSIMGGLNFMRRTPAKV